MYALDESDLLLDLLREAGDEPVTLDELHVVGVQEPAEALLALELAGHAVHRVYESSSRPGRTVACVRLGAPRPVAADTPEPTLRPEPEPVPEPATDGRLVAGALVALLLLLVLGLRRRH